MISQNMTIVLILVLSMVVLGVYAILALPDASAAGAAVMGVHP